MNIAGVVLAGGQSKRMGQDKSLLKIQGKTLLEHTSNILSISGIQNIYISAGITANNGILDIYPNKGPIGGILSCLLSLKEYSYVLFIPVDMPLLTKKIIQELINTNQQSLIHFENYNLPLMIKNNENIRKILENQIKSEQLSIHKLMQKLDTHILKTKHKQESFMNTNSPQQWNKLFTSL